LDTIGAAGKARPPDGGADGCSATLNVVRRAKDDEQVRVQPYGMPRGEQTMNEEVGVPGWTKARVPGLSVKVVSPYRHWFMPVCV